jgi:hypothetical protein
VGEIWVSHGNKFHDDCPSGCCTYSLVLSDVSELTASLHHPGDGSSESFSNVGKKIFKTTRWNIQTYWRVSGLRPKIWNQFEWLWWDETMSQNCGNERAYSSPGWFVRMEGHSDDDAGWGWLPYSSTRALWQSYQQRHLGQVGVMDEGVRILPISIWNTSRDL